MGLQTPADLLCRRFAELGLVTVSDIMMPLLQAPAAASKR